MNPSIHQSINHKIHEHSQVVDAVEAVESSVAEESDGVAFELEDLQTLQATERQALDLVDLVLGQLTARTHTQ
jgi:hypothetical protein